MEMIHDQLIPEHIADSRLATFLQKELARRKMFNQEFKGKRLCGSQRSPNASPTILLLSDGKQKSSFYGLARCHSTWGCPICTPKRMAEYGTRIGAAIEALKFLEDSVPFMMTLTMPHKIWMNINDVYQILLNSWRQFARGAKATRTAKKIYTLKKNVGEDKRAVGKVGDIQKYTIRQKAPFLQLREDFHIKHTVRVYEFTWGENGWHPHIHGLFWVPIALFDKLNDDWEQKIADDWFKILRQQAIKYYNSKYPDKAETNTEIINKLFNDQTKKHNSVNFSKDKSGKVRQVKSSLYISGWGGDMEVSNERKYKRAQPGHYSPLQILQKAYENQDDDRDKWFNLYVDYLRATFGKRRVQFSMSGINEIAANWMLTNQWQEVIKKKLTVAEIDNWKVVCWFSDEQWLQISLFNLQTKLLELALLSNARQEIDKFLEQYDIHLSPKKHWFESVIEKEYTSATEYILGAYTTRATRFKKNAAAS